MNKFSFMIVVLMLTNFWLLAEDKGEKKMKIIKPAHGGVVLLLSQTEGLIEYVHNSGAGEMTIYILNPDGTPKKIKDTPKIILFAADGVSIGKKTLASKFKEENSSEGDVFIGKDDILKAKELTGRIFVAIGQSTYQVNLTLDTQEQKLKREEEEKKEMEKLKKEEEEKAKKEAAEKK
jgi:hypothetical protein